MTWTHVICLPCWQERAGDRVPCQLKNAPLEDCCFCGSPTTLGIYVRENPAALHCEHPEED